MVQEKWEMTTGGTVWVQVVVDKVRGTTKDKKVQGRGATLRIDSEDRKLAQERVRNEKSDPFTNGTLILVEGTEEAKAETASPSALTDEQLLGFLSKKQGAAFKKAVEPLSEVAFRRLRTLMRDNDSVTSAQSKAMQEIYDENYNPNKDWVDPGGDHSEAIAATFPEVNLSSGVERKDAPRN